MPNSAAAAAAWAAPRGNATNAKGSSQLGPAPAGSPDAQVLKLLLVLGSVDLVKDLRLCCGVAAAGQGNMLACSGREVAAEEWLIERASSRACACRGRGLDLTSHKGGPQGPAPRPLGLRCRGLRPPA